MNSSHSQPKTRWGLIGVGDIANKRVASAIQADPNSELVAVCRRSEQELNHFADEFTVARRFTDAGKHVLVEKPMALNPLECEKMIAACDSRSDRKANQRSHRVGLPRREQMNSKPQSSK